MCERVINLVQLKNWLWMVFVRVRPPHVSHTFVRDTYACACGGLNTPPRTTTRTPTRTHTRTTRTTHPDAANQLHQCKFLHHQIRLRTTIPTLFRDRHTPSRTTVQIPSSTPAVCTTSSGCGASGAAAGVAGFSLPAAAPAATMGQDLSFCWCVCSATHDRARAMRPRPRERSATPPSKPERRLCSGVTVPPTASRAACLGALVCHQPAAKPGWCQHAATRTADQQVMFTPGWITAVLFKMVTPPSSRAEDRTAFASSPASSQSPLAFPPHPSNWRCSCEPSNVMQLYATQGDIG